MLEEFFKEYLNIDSLEDIINVNVDNLTIDEFNHKEEIKLARMK